MASKADPDQDADPAEAEAEADVDAVAQVPVPVPPTSDDPTFAAQPTENGDAHNGTSTQPTPPLALVPPTTIKIWGSRGSIPRSEPSMIRHGGSTSCVEYVSASGTRVILDMGSGSYSLGQTLVTQYFGVNARSDLSDEAKSKEKRKYGKGNIFITHTHWDHIQGFPFFVPLFIPGMEWDVYGPRGSAGSIRDSLAGQMQYDYFPVNLNFLGAEIEYHDLTEGTFYVGKSGDRDDGEEEGGEDFVPPPVINAVKPKNGNNENGSNNGGDDKNANKNSDKNDNDNANANANAEEEDQSAASTTTSSLCRTIGGDVQVTTHYLHHPCLTLGYRLRDTTTNTTLCYITDHEPYDMRMGTEGYTPPSTLERRTADDRHVEFIQGCDVLLHDSQYTAEQYGQKVTWGHSTVEYVVDVAMAAGVKRLGLFHHDPMRTDEQVEELVLMAKQRVQERKGLFRHTVHEEMEIFAAFDKQELVMESNPLLLLPGEKGSMGLKDGAKEGKEEEEEDDAEDGDGTDTSKHTRGTGGSVSRGANNKRPSLLRRDSAISEPAGPTPAEEFCGHVTLVFRKSDEARPIAALLEVECDVKIFTNPRDALAVAEKDLSSLYIVQQDTGVDVSGVEFVEKIRSMGNWGMQVPILIETADQTVLESIRADGDEAGVTDWVSKPYSPEYVRTKAHIAMSRSPCRWRKAELPPDEDERLEALRSTGLLDTKPEERFDRLTRIASQTFDVQTVLISLVDEDRQWFKSCTVELCSQTPRDQAFCAHAILQDNVFLIQDASKDDRFADNPLVTGGVVRFYAGVPLAIPGKDKLKHRIGTLCLIDSRPRDLDPKSIALLQDLGHLVENEIELSMTAKKANARLKTESQSLRTEKTLDTALLTEENGHTTPVANASCCVVM